MQVKPGASRSYRIPRCTAFYVSGAILGCRNTSDRERQTGWRSCSCGRFFSSDGEKWTHANSDISACQLQMCVACKKEGCFSSNGLITNIFQEKTTYSQFPSNAELTSKWSRSSSTICFVGTNLQCASLKQVDQATNSEGPPSPVAVSPGPLGATDHNSTALHSLPNGPNTNRQGCTRCVHNKTNDHDRKERNHDECRIRWCAHT